MGACNQVFLCLSACHSNLRRGILESCDCMSKSYPSLAAISVCQCERPLKDTLYPTSIYVCGACGEAHGTRPANGAVNWQCVRELFSGPSYHAPAEQTYSGFLCVRCHGFVNLERETKETALRRSERAGRWDVTPERYQSAIGFLEKLYPVTTESEVQS